MAAKLLTRTEKVANLKTRVGVVKDILPVNYKATIFQKYPKYNCNMGVNLINNVIALRSTDEELTEILEAIAKSQSDKVE